MSVQSPVRVYYPTSDGKPMAETDLHRDDMNYLIEALKEFFRDDSQVYVTGNILLYYEEGNPQRCVSPDVMVVKGIEKRRRDNYLLWEEGKGPDVVIEVTSKKTRKQDREKKYDLYEQVLQVKEYFQYDPRQEWIKEGIRGHRLIEGTYEPIERLPSGRWWSAELGVELALEGGQVHVYDPVTERKLLRREEMESALREAEIRAAEEAAARRQVEAELERLRAELVRRRTEPRE